MTNLIEQVNVDQLAEQAIGHYGWLLVAAFVTLLFKDVLFNFVQGILVFWGSDFENDEILYISGRQARVIRLGITSCTFFLTDRLLTGCINLDKVKTLEIDTPFADFEIIGKEAGE